MRTRQVIIMELMGGPTFTIDVSSSSPQQQQPPPSSYCGDHPSGDAGEHEVPSSLFGDGSGFRVGGQPEFFAGESSESSSSIGTPDDSDDEVSSKRDREEGEEEEEEVQSKLNGLGSLDSLEDSLPIKRGLSSHFVGKSKSFTDLSQVSTVKELQKQENPFNKRRRVLIASKWSRRSSFYSWSNPKSMPLLPVDEDEDDYEEAEKARKVSPSSSSSSSSPEEKKPQDQVQLRQHNIVPQSYAAHMRLRLGSFKSRSFSLADLQEHDDEEEEDNDG